MEAGLKSITLTILDQEEATKAPAGKYGEPTKRIPMQLVNRLE